jgi:hypothetical protein
VHGDASGDSGGGPVPPDNRPGHHPPVDQDKPRRSPPSSSRRSRRARRADAGAARAAASSDRADEGEDRRADVTSFGFDFEPRLRPLALLAGVTPSTTRVEVSDRELRVRFGPWTLRTPLANVAGTELTGPYTWWKVAGGAHLSLADGGITFATTTAGGVCISFHEPVPGLVPGSAVRHPGATVTVDDSQGLVAAIEGAQLRLLDSTTA